MRAFFLFQTFILLIGGSLASANPPMLMAGGYLSSDLTPSGGQVAWLGIASPDGQLPSALQVSYQGLPIGIQAALTDPATGVYELSFPLPAGMKPSRYFLEFGPATGADLAWPALAVIEQAAPTDTPTPSPTATDTETPWPTHTPTGPPTATPTLVPPYFRNVSSETSIKGFDSKRNGFYDIDGDGWLDIMFNHVNFLLNRPLLGGDGRIFVDVTTAAGLSTIADLNGVLRMPTVTILGDVDNDGDLDIYSGMYLDFLAPTNPTPDRGFRSAVFLNDGLGRFTLVEPSGVEGNPGTEVPAAFFDYDNDGCLDIAVGYTYTKYGVSYEAYPNRLYKGHCDGTFTDVTARAALLTDPNPNATNSSRPTFGVTHCDWNDDGWQDLFYCVYGRQRNYQWKNNGDGTFTDVAEETTWDGDGIRNDTTNPWFRQHGNSFSAQAADFDNDGYMDMALGEITHSWAGPASDLSTLLRNLGPDENWKFQRTFRGTDRPHANPNNWNQGDLHVAWMDFDLDGLQDWVLGSGDYDDGQYLRLFRQDPGGPLPGIDGWFTDITALADFNWEGTAGISVGDYDRDGAPDMLAGRSLMRLSSDKALRYGTHGGLFQNLSSPGRHWVTIRLEGKGQGFSNRQGIGAKITVRTGTTTQIREIYGGGGHAGQMNAQEAYFGLGPSERIDQLSIRWPNSTHSVQTWYYLPGNKVYVIREGEQLPVEWMP